MSPIPYELVPLVVSIALAIVFVAVSDVSRRAKLGVAALVAGSLVVRSWSPAWGAAATAVQVIVSVGIVVSFRLRG